MTLAATPADRLAEVLRRWPALAASFGDATPVESYSNDVWEGHGRYLRVCWRGDRRRLEKEALVLAHLPAGVPTPEVADAGGDDELTWMVTGTVAGENLEARWASLSDHERRTAVHACATAVRALHAWDPPAVVVESLTTSTSDDADTIAGSDLLPLPMHRAHRLAEAAAERGIVDAALAQDLRDRLDELGTFDPFAGGEPLVVIHGDLSIGNVLWSADDDLAAVLDFEWARLGPPDLELLSFCAASTPVEAWTVEAYPEAFTHPHLRQRLWLYELTYTLRQRILWGTPGTLRDVVGALPPNVERLLHAAR